MTNLIEIKRKESNKGELCNSILRSLPEWFGIEEAIVDYTNDVEKMISFVAINDDKEIGFISLNQHNDHNLEIHAMGILPDYHRQGIGQKLIQTAESYAKKGNFKFLTVKTLSPKRESAEYKKTRLFYKSVGFIELEEFETLWGKDNPCLMMIKPII